MPLEIEFIHYTYPILGRKIQKKLLWKEQLLSGLAETVGFEPTEDLHPQRISSPLHSASLPRFQQIKIILRLAEAVRFELTEGYQPSTVFKTVALNRSATLPSLEAGIIMKFVWFAK